MNDIFCFLNLKAREVICSETVSAGQAGEILQKYVSEQWVANAFAPTENKLFRSHFSWNPLLCFHCKIVISFLVGNSYQDFQKRFLFRFRKLKRTSDIFSRFALHYIEIQEELIFGSFRHPFLVLERNDRQVPLKFAKIPFIWFIRLVNFTKKKKPKWTPC